MKTYKQYITENDSIPLLVDYLNNLSEEDLSDVLENFSTASLQELSNGYIGAYTVSDFRSLSEAYNLKHHAIGSAVIAGAAGAAAGARMGGVAGAVAGGVGGAVAGAAGSVVRHAVGHVVTKVGHAVSKVAGKIFNRKKPNVPPKRPVTA